MISSTLTTVVVLCQCLSIAASDPKVVSMKLNRRERTEPTIAARDPISVPISNGLIHYVVNATVGTPPQNISFILDTGSSDTWMPTPNACPKGSPCNLITFDSSKSSTFSTLNQGGFQASYADSSKVLGDFISDTLSIGGKAMPNFTMGYGSQITGVPAGIVGVGLDALENEVQHGGKPYTGFIDAMVDNSLINSRSFSLWLDDLKQLTGNILFGGYDTGKFGGELVLLNMQPDASTGTVRQYAVAWTWLSITDPSGTTQISGDNFQEAAVLDSGTSFLTVPSDVLATVATYFNAVPNTSMGNLVRCDIASQPGTLDFGFGGNGGPLISVPFSELVLPTKDPTTGKAPTFEEGAPACVLGLMASIPSAGVNFLGDTFLRSAYVVYDIDAQMIGIAPTKFNSTDSNIVEITSGNSTQGQGSEDSFVTAISSAATGVLITQSMTDQPATVTTSLLLANAVVPTSVPTGVASVAGNKTSIAVQTFAPPAQTTGNSPSGTARAAASSSSSAAAMPGATPPGFLGMESLVACVSVVLAMVFGGEMMAIL